MPKWSAYSERRKALELPDPNNRAEFDAFIEMMVARECLAVRARDAELTEALEYLQERVNEADEILTVHAAALSRDAALAARAHERARNARARARRGRDPLAAVRAPLGGGGVGAAHDARRAKIRLKYAPFWRRALHKLFCIFTCGGGYACLVPSDETPEEALERVVRAKVRKDVRLAIAWDAELDELEGDAQEKRLELARFELLNPSEQSIYVTNGGLAEEEEPPAPVAGWKKYVFAS